MESLDNDARKRVLAWLGQKLGVEVAAGKFSASKANDKIGAGAFDLSTDTIATVLGAKSGVDVPVAAAAQLHFVQGKQRFTRQELTAEMRTAPAHFKESFVNNLSKYLTGLTKVDRLRLVAADTYALSSKERQDLETKLAEAA
jgi:hypothetical protein